MRNFWRRASSALRGCISNCRNEVMKWITREKVKVDRIACPWLIKKFVDSEAEFLFVPVDVVREVAKRENATPFDSPEVELTHYKENGIEHVSFDAIIKKYNLK